jgi:hypothetical protein
MVYTSWSWYIGIATDYYLLTIFFRLTHKADHEDEDVLFNKKLYLPTLYLVKFMSQSIFYFVLLKLTHKADHEDVLF